MYHCMFAHFCKLYQSALYRQKSESTNRKPIANRQSMGFMSLLLGYEHTFT